MNKLILTLAIIIVCISADKPKPTVLLILNKNNQCAQCIKGMPERLALTAKSLKQLKLGVIVYSQPMLIGEKLDFIKSYGFDKRNVTFVDNIDSLYKYVKRFKPKTPKMEMARSFVVYKDSQQRDSIYYLDAKSYFQEDE